MKTTKRIIAMLLFAITMTTVLNSCSKESTNERRIIGKWVETSAVESSYSEDGTLLYIKHDDTGYILEFRSDGTCFLNGILLVKYSLDGNVLNFGEAFGEGNEPWEIVELTNSTMVWEREHIMPPGEYDTHHIIYHWEFEKQ